MKRIASGCDFLMLWDHDFQNVNQYSVTKSILRFDWDCRDHLK